MCFICCFTHFAHNSKNDSMIFSLFTLNLIVICKFKPLYYNKIAHLLNLFTINLYVLKLKKYKITYLDQ